jgi:hypothetical protein
MEDEKAPSPPDLGLEDLAAFAETWRKVYLSAPKTWAPVVAAAVARPEACEMVASVAKAGARAILTNCSIMEYRCGRSPLIDRQHTVNKSDSRRAR